MSIETGTRRQMGSSILADFQRVLDQHAILTAEVAELRRERDALKTVVDHARVVEELPALKAQLEATRTEAREILTGAKAEAARIVTEAEETARGIVAEVAAVKAKATQGAALIIADGERLDNQRADEVFGERTRLLADRETRVAAREREVAHALHPYREARARLLAAMDAVEKIPTMTLRTGEA